jgi:vacuolar-type H+-ATPase catalytic subunit A/Vma1
VLHNKVSILEIVSEEHRQKNINAILERKKLADARVRQRLMVRRKSKQIKQQQQIKQKVSPEQLVSIEKIRLRLYEKIQTGQKLQAIFNQLDIDHSGMLSKNEFNTLILKVFEKKTAMLNGNMLDLIWEAIWEQRKHGANDEIDASTLSHWLQL